MRGGGLSDVATWVPVEGPGPPDPTLLSSYISSPLCYSVGARPTKARQWLGHPL